jgi:ParB-like chromosome segregation protein Spo0J
MTTKTPKVPPAAWRNRITGSDLVDPSQLLANPANWRTHPAAQRDALRGSLDAVGWVQQVIVNTVTGHVVDGHARIEEAISRGEPMVPVAYVELSPEDEALVLATLDPIGALATAEKDALAALLAGLAPSDDTLRSFLAELAERNGIHRAIPGDPDEIPAVPGGSRPLRQAR